MDMNEIMVGGFLRGKRSYILGWSGFVLSLGAGIVGYLVGDMPLQDLVTLVITGIGSLGVVTAKAASDK